ncbi:MAG: ImmA/IrrE family metallo-endopeptidase [Oscillospiraceae bacterium]
MSVVKIARHFDINVVKNSVHDWLKPSQSGISFVTEDGEWVIVYDDSDSMGRKRFTIAHELGDILLGHPLRDGSQHAQTFDKHRPRVESEADMFAARLLAPACVLWGLGLHNATVISDVCRISYAAARVRAERMKILYEREKFLASPLERQVFEAFKPWIEQHNGG